MKKKVTRRERKKLLDEMVKIAQENGEYLMKEPKDNFMNKDKISQAGKSMIEACKQAVVAIQDFTKAYEKIKIQGAE